MCLAASLGVCVAADAGTPAGRPARAWRWQGIIVDEGSFTVWRAGAKVGRENFTIRRAADGGYAASGTVVYADRRLLPALATDPLGVALQYQVDVRVPAGRQEMLSGRVTRGFFSARSQTAQGESAREFAVSAGARLIDDSVFHQYFFLALGHTGAVAVIEPRHSRQVIAQVEARGADPVEIDGQPLPATRLHIELPGTPGRDLWVDTNGRVLAVADPGDGLMARRDVAPR